MSRAFLIAGRPLHGAGSRWKRRSAPWCRKECVVGSRRLASSDLVAAPIISSDLPQRLAGVRARIASFMDGWEFRPFHVDGQAVASLVTRAVAWRSLGFVRPPP